MQPELGLFLKQRLPDSSVDGFVNAVARPRVGVAARSGPLHDSALGPGLQKCRAVRPPTPMSAQLQCFARSLARNRSPRVS